MKEKIKKVYCDSGGYQPWLKKLEKEGRIKLYHFPHDENIIKKIIRKILPSAVAWNSEHYTWDDENLNWDFGGKTDKFNKISEIVGNNSDARHLDTAYKNKCDYFFTSDKKDILTNRVKLEELLGFEIYHFINDKKKFLKEINIINET